MRRLVLGGVVTLAVALACVNDVHAHAEGASARGLSAGLAHPVSGLDHVLAMVSVGLWGAQLGAPALWLLPLVFPLVMACGGFLGLLGLPLPGVEIGIALSALLLGVAVATATRPPLLVAAILVGVFAVFHGHAHATELPPGGSAILYSMGFVVATGALHGAGIALGLVCRWKLGRIAVRVAGLVVALCGCVFLYRAVA